MAQQLKLRLRTVFNRKITWRCEAWYGLFAKFWGSGEDPTCWHACRLRDRGKTSNDFWNFGVLQMLTTFRVRAVESVHQAGKLWIQLTSRFDFTVPGTGEPTKYGGRDADPEKPIVMGKCRLGCGSTRGGTVGMPALHWLADAWCSRYRMSMAKNDLLGEGSSSICRKAEPQQGFLPIFDVGVWIFGKLSKPTGFPILQRNNLTPGFSFLNTNATASFLIFKECLQYSYTRSASHCAAFWWMT